MTALVDFLLARVSDDEAAARDEAEQRRAETLATARAFGVAHLTVGGPFDPAHVLAECTAKRQIIAAHPSGTHDCRWDRYPTGYLLPGCVTLMALALPYANHPEFRPEWTA